MLFRTRPAGFFRTVPRTLLLFERNFDWRITGRWMVYSAIVGVLVSLAALAFAWMVLSVSRLALVDLAGYAIPLPSGEVDQVRPFDLRETLTIPRRWLLLILPTLGGLLTGWIVTRYAPEA
ncbi:MAG TPA: chloride channel protein, partial [Rhodothermales bacterium]